MTVLALVNCLRASNFINIMWHDVDNAQKGKTLGEACIIKSKKYKVLIIYGAKIILSSKDIYKQLQLYIKYIWPKFMTDTHRSKKDRCVLFSCCSDEKILSKPEPTNHWMVTKSITRSFEKAKVFADKQTYNSILLSHQIQHNYRPYMSWYGRDGKYSTLFCKTW